MKIRKITHKEGFWIDFPAPVDVKTRNGTEQCRRAYISGIRDVFSLRFSDNSTERFTDNHRLLSSQGDWCCVSDIKAGFEFNNGLQLLSKEPAGRDFVLDIEVPNCHHYILRNGVCSHNSSFLLGQVSPGIELVESNYYVKKLAKGTFTYKNPHLKDVLKKHKQDEELVWESILLHGGSVQHLDFLSENERDVFKTFGEVSQKEIVIQASQRQKHIDQSQSLNLLIPKDTKPKEVSDLLIYGWQNGIKTFYYQRGTNPAQQLARSILTCTSCES